MSEFNRSAKEMTDEYYSDLPEGISAAALAPYVLKCIADSSREAPAVTVMKLSELGDRQWHSYELPSDAVRSAVRGWILQRFAIDSRAFLEEFLAVGYEFAFDKKAFHQLLEAYGGEHRQEFEEDMQRSSGAFIDPWWSLRKEPNQPPQPMPLKRHG